MPLKLLGIALVLAGLVFRHQFIRARQRGYVGPNHRRIDRAGQRARFHLALAKHALAALICFVAAFLCLTHALHGL